MNNHPDPAGRLVRWLQRLTIGRRPPNRPVAAITGVFLITRAIILRGSLLDGFLFTAPIWTVAFIIAGALLLAVATRPALGIRALAGAFTAPLLIARTIQLALTDNMTIERFFINGGLLWLLLAVYVTTLLAYWTPTDYTIRHNGGRR